MKLDFLEDGYLFFTNEVCFLDSEKNISDFLKNMFLSINEIFSVELYGYFKTDIYVDDKIGIFVEITKLDDYFSYNKKIDTKVTLFRENFYLKFKDLSKIFNYRPIYRMDNYYYISTNDVDNILELLDFCEIEYKDISLKLISI